MQNWYGLAIRQNSDVYTMKEAIGAILWHCTYFLIKTTITDILSSFNSWKTYLVQVPERQGIWEITHVNKINLSEYIHKIFEPIFVNLSDDVLLLINACMARPKTRTRPWTKSFGQNAPKLFVHKTVIDKGAIQLCFDSMTSCNIECLRVLWFSRWLCHKQYFPARGKV